MNFDINRFEITYSGCFTVLTLLFGFAETMVCHLIFCWIGSSALKYVVVWKVAKTWFKMIIWVITINHLDHIMPIDLHDNF